jgi:hypothetical protein
MENLFSNLVKKVKEEHMQFRRWVGLFGFNPETMNFINMINDNNYNNISGVYMNQILSALFMNEDKTLETNFSPQHCQQTFKELEEALDRIKDLYLTEGRKEKMSVSTSLSLSAADIPGLGSRITQEHDYIRSLFPKPNLKSATLLYRASENNFSVL